MNPGDRATEYAYRHGEGFPHHAFLFPVLEQWLRGNEGPLLDIGCGNGALTGRVHQALGIPCVGIDNSLSGVGHAQRSHPGVEFLNHSISDPLPITLRQRFRTVIAMELIEHLFLPGQLFARAEEALLPGGTLVISTPYHAYLKNVVIALSGKFDAHVNPTLDFGHIKFFSPTTLRQVAERSGWKLVELERVGRIKPIAKSMVARFERA